MTVLTSTEVKIEKRQVYRGYCTNTFNIGLSTDVLYYLQPHGKAHYFVSKFPFVKESFIGVIRKDCFRIEREESVTIKKKLSSQTGYFIPYVENSDKFNTLTISKNETPITTSHKEPKPETKLLFSGLYNVQDESEEPNSEGVPSDLKWGVTYKADLIYRRPGFSPRVELGTYYIQRIPKDNPYYNEVSCNFYTDAECQNCKGNFPLHWFNNFIAIDHEEEALIEVAPTKAATESLETKEVVIENEENQPNEKELVLTDVKEASENTIGKESADVLSEPKCVETNIPMSMNQVHQQHLIEPKKKSKKKEDEKDQLSLFDDFF